MTVDFKNLKALADRDFATSLPDALAARAQQYHNVIPEEVLDLLEEAAECYTCVEAALPHSLRDIARKEIEFFIWVYQDKIKHFPHIQNPQPPQQIRDILQH